MIFAPARHPLYGMLGERRREAGATAAPGHQYISATDTQLTVATSTIDGEDIQRS